MPTIQALVRLSTHTMGDKEHQRCLWAVEIPNSLLSTIVEDHHFIRMDGHDNTLIIQFVTDGIPVIAGKVMAKADGLGIRHTKGIGLPTEKLDPISMYGDYDDESLTISIKDELPAPIASLIHSVDDLTHDTEIGRHFPGLDFEAVIDKAES